MFQAKVLNGVQLLLLVGCWGVRVTLHRLRRRLVCLALLLELHAPFLDFC